MFGLFRRDPKKKLEIQYARKLEAARDAQRNGDILGYSDLITESEEILKEIDQLTEAVEDDAR